MARVYLHQQIYDLAQSEFADRLETRPSLLKTFDLTKLPSQQSISYAWEKFSMQTKQTLDAAATGIALEAVDHGVIMEARVPIVPSDNDTHGDENEPTATRKHVREHGSKVVELARRHAFGEFDSHRADNTVYEDEQILDLFSLACLNQGSGHSEGEASWFFDENHICDDSTFLRMLKQFAMPAGQDVLVSLQEQQIEDIVAFIEVFHEYLMDAFDTATENILQTIQYEDPFDHRHVVAAVDFIHVPTTSGRGSTRTTVKIRFRDSAAAREFCVPSVLSRYLSDFSLFLEQCQRILGNHDRFTVIPASQFDLHQQVDRPPD